MDDLLARPKVSEKEHFLSLDKTMHISFSFRLLNKMDARIANKLLLSLRLGSMAVHSKCQQG